MLSDCTSSNCMSLPVSYADSLHRNLNAVGVQLLLKSVCFGHVQWGFAVFVDSNRTGSSLKQLTTCRRMTIHCSLHEQAGTGISKKQPHTATNRKKANSTSPYKGPNPADATDSQQNEQSMPPMPKSDISSQHSSFDALQQYTEQQPQHASAKQHRQSTTACTRCRGVLP